MGFFKKFFEKVFGNSQHNTEPSIPRHNANHVRWEKERNFEILELEKELKDWLVTVLKEIGSLQFSWQSGDDEAFVSFQHKKDIYDDDLEQYIIKKLDIPSAGEFQMNGRGTIYIEDDLVSIKYSSVMKVTIDFDEEAEEEIFHEEEHDSGEEILFSI